MSQELRACTALVDISSLVPNTLIVWPCGLQLPEKSDFGEI